MKILKILFTLLSICGITYVLATHLITPGVTKWLLERDMHTSETVVGVVTSYESYVKFIGADEPTYTYDYQGATYQYTDKEFKVWFPKIGHKVRLVIYNGDLSTIRLARIGRFAHFIAAIPLVLLLPVLVKTCYADIPSIPPRQKKPKKVKVKKDIEEKRDALGLQDAEAGDEFET